MESSSSASPRDNLLQFLQSTYEAGAKLANWDRLALERGNEITKQTSSQ